MFVESTICLLGYIRGSALQSCVHCVRGGILYVAKHGLAFELVVQFLRLKQLPVLLLVCLCQFLILSAEAVVVEIHAS